MDNNSLFDAKKTVKQWFIYLVIAFPFILIVATLLTIIKAPLWAILVCNVLVGGAVVVLEYVIHTKIKQKREKESKINDFDPFKD